MCAFNFFFFFLFFHSFPYLSFKIVWMLWRNIQHLNEKFFIFVRFSFLVFDASNACAEIRIKDLHWKCKSKNRLNFFCLLLKQNKKWNIVTADCWVQNMKKHIHTLFTSWDETFMLCTENTLFDHIETRNNSEKWMEKRNSLAYDWKIHAIMRSLCAAAECEWVNEEQEQKKQAQKVHIYSMW